MCIVSAMCMQMQTLLSPGALFCIYWLMRLELDEVGTICIRNHMHPGRNHMYPRL